MTAVFTDRHIGKPDPMVRPHQDYLPETVSLENIGGMRRCGCACGFGVNGCACLEDASCYRPPQRGGAF